jgi:hypothetical protein
LILFVLWPILAFLPWETTNALYGQTSWRPLAAACQSAGGSGTAEENLGKLKTQAPITPEIAAAISACEARAASLRQDEKRVWVSALDAKSKWDCEDSRRQFKSLVEKASFYQIQASTELKRLGDCGQQIVSEESPELILQHAQAAYKSRDFHAAREQSWHIVALKNSVGDEARKVLKDIEQIEDVNEQLRRVDRAMRTGKVHDACSLLLRIQQTNPAFPNMSEVKSRLNGCPAATAEVAIPASPKSELDKQVATTKLHIEEANLELAGVSLSTALKLAPNDKTVLQLQESFRLAKQARDLLDTGVSLIYQAKYPEATEQLANVVTGNTSSGLVARAHFYIGVAIAHQFYLQNNNVLKTKAMMEFQVSMNDYKQPDFDQVSPKIKQLYDEAIQN